VSLAFFATTACDWLRGADAGDTLSVPLCRSGGSLRGRVAGCSFTGPATGRAGPWSCWLADWLGLSARPQQTPGVQAARVRELGWIPVGIDVSAAMLRHARVCLLRWLTPGGCRSGNGCVPAVIAVMVHTDMPAYPAVLRVSTLPDLLTVCGQWLLASSGKF